MNPNLKHWLVAVKIQKTKVRDPSLLSACCATMYGNTKLNSEIIEMMDKQYSSNTHFLHAKCSRKTRMKLENKTRQWNLRLTNWTSWDEFAYCNFPTCYPNLLYKLPHIQTYFNNAQFTHSYMWFTYMNYLYHYIAKDFCVKTTWILCQVLRMYFVIYGVDIP